MEQWLLIIMAIVGQIFTAGAIYGALRGDIKALIQGVIEAKAAANEAHKRLDNLLMIRKGNHG